MMRECEVHFASKRQTRLIVQIQIFTTEEEELSFQGVRSALPFPLPQLEGAAGLKTGAGGEPWKGMVKEEKGIVKEEKER